MTDPERDYYQVLGVARDADAKVIKDAYHRLAMKWHPDRNKAPDAEERFKEIAKAYAVLHDPSKRARYDARGFEGVAHFSDDDLFRNVDLGSLFGDLGFGFGPGGDSILDRFFSARRGPRRGDNIRVRLEVALERIASGGQEMVHLRRPVACERCHGHGTRDGRPPEACKVCGGSGQKLSAKEETRQVGQRVHIQRITACEACHGEGTLAGDPCHDCGGRGRTDVTERLKVNIPAGFEDGMTLRVPGHGLPGGAGAPPGDLHVIVFAAPDARFQRRGADLWRNETVDVTDAALGTRLVVPTLMGDVEVKVPPGTQPDEVLRLRSKGLPRLDGSGHGDLNLRIQVHVPDKLSDDEAALYEKLRAIRR